MSKPIASVVITCYNYGRYLKEAIESVRRQSYSNLEVIVIDDGSTDDSGEIAQSFKGVRYIYQTNSGVIATRNKGLEEVKGDFIIFLDADDTIEPNYIEELVNTAETEHADIVYTDVRKFGDSSGVSNFPDFNIEIIKNKNIIHVSSLIRVSAIKGVRFDERMRGMTHEDWDFFLSLCVNGAVAVKCKTVFLGYRIHGPSRNNTRQTIQEKRAYMETYLHIMSKYSERSNFSYLAGPTFCRWYKDLDEKMQYENNTKPTVREAMSSLASAITRKFGRMKGESSNDK